MAIRYFCLDDKYMIPDPEWSWINNGSDQCYVKSKEYESLQRELEETKNQLRYFELSKETK